MSAFDDQIRAMPKVELHVHLEGSIGAAAACGKMASEALRNQPNTPSSRPSAACSTQMVTASGSQTSKPAIRYFFTRVLGASAVDSFGIA